MERKIRLEILKVFQDFEAFFPGFEIINKIK